MEVVDAVEVHVLRVPGKGGLPHAKVEVGRVHPRDAHPKVIHHRVQDGVEVVDVPLLNAGVGETAGDVRPIERLVERHILPVLAFKLLEILRLGWFVSAEKSTVTLLPQSLHCDHTCRCLPSH